MGDNGQPVAFVTGAARGIGEAVVHAFASRGYRVVASDALALDSWALDRAQTAIAESRDVREEAAVAALIARADSELGRIDVLANVAGVVLVKPLDETTWEDYRDVVDI